jgi:hypothetical protein
MTDMPITPARDIPPSTALPARPPEPGELPPWHTAPAPTVPPRPPTPPDPPICHPDPPAPVEAHPVHDLVLTWADPDPEPDPPLWRRAWDWLFDHLVTWRMLLAICAALLPWAGGHSPVGLWSRVVQQARTEAGIPAAYTIAAVAIAAAWALDHRTGRALPRFLFVTATVGAVGVIDWWDPMLLLTGVGR